MDRADQLAQAGMFELLSGLVTTEEGVRAQLAADLHDTVAQSLLSARALLAEGPPDAERSRFVTQLVEEAEEQVRAIMARTRVPALRDGDLARAVGNLRADMRQRYGLEIDAQWPSEPHPLPSATAITVYRFFQEALLNVVKHADVDRAAIVLRAEDGWFVASVTDEGPGFDPEAVHSTGGRHVGLGLLRERVRRFGGALDVQSWPARGVTVTLRLPRVHAARPARRTVPPQRVNGAGARRLSASVR
jgi:signal transduction histidine kinase